MPISSESTTPSSSVVVYWKRVSIEGKSCRTTRKQIGPHRLGIQGACNLHVFDQSLYLQVVGKWELDNHTNDALLSDAS